VPTNEPTTPDTIRLTLEIQLSGPGVCDLALNYTDDVRQIITDAIYTKGNSTLSVEDVGYYNVDGCGSRRRRRLSANNVITITMMFTTSISGSNYITADGFYDYATESLVAAKATITAQFMAACGCTIHVDTIKVQLSTRWAPLDTTYEETVETVVPYYAGADCPNACSGHGTCTNNGCLCWAGWGNGDETGGACDQRKCPYEIAWVDVPTYENKAHALRECAGRGICDRETGECNCLTGFTGKGCKRSTCPNDCSGHGTCKYLAELRNDVGDNFKWTGNLPTRDQYSYQFPLLWDAYKTRGCVCDPKYTGVDCSIKMCPRGDYARYFTLMKRPETQAVVITNVFTPGTDGGDDDQTYRYSTSNDGNDQNGEFALTFRSTLNEEFTTKTLNVYNLTESSLEIALNSLPNRVIEDVTVMLYRNLSKYNASTYYSNKNYGNAVNAPYPFGRANSQYNYTWYDTDLVALISYSGSMTTGDQYALECKTAYCGAGCQPKLENPLDFKQGSECIVVNDFKPAIAMNWECSGRGTCMENGVCKCFEGYRDESCSNRVMII
jgi:hypothetical protein